MRAIIQSIAQETQVRDRQGQVLTTIKGRVFTLILRSVIMGLIAIFLLGFSALMYNFITQGISDNVSFGMYN
jgi:hypothetical protein